LNKGSGIKFSKGFTLIEVLIASLLICLSAASITYLLQTGIRSVALSRRTTKEMMVTSSVMEELRSRPFGDLLSMNGYSFDNGKGKIAITSVGADLVSINLKDNIELDTLRSRY
jgi:prepilin-type N-terminal cleavage/methylation domain-containing protein